MFQPSRCHPQGVLIYYVSRVNKMRVPIRMSRVERPATHPRSMARPFLRAKIKLNCLNIQVVPRSKHASSRLQETVNAICGDNGFCSVVLRKHVHALNGQNVGFLNFKGLEDVRWRDGPQFCVEKSEIFIAATEHYCILGCVAVCAFVDVKSSNLSVVQKYPEGRIRVVFPVN